MADTNRTSTDSLKKLSAFQEQPFRYGFFSAIRMLDCSLPDQPRTGRSDRPSNEIVRIGQAPTLRFAPSTIASFKRRDSSAKWHLQTYFFGVFGANGPMPTHLTEFAEQRVSQNRDETFARFADLFHHRMASFFYRAWGDSQPTVHMDRAESDRFATYVASLCGVGTPALRNRDGMPDKAKLYFCAQLASNTRHSAGLEAILASFYGSQVEIVPFVSHWIRLPEECQWKLGRSRESGTLGDSVTLGARVHDCQQRFLIVMGPLDYKAFCTLLPHGSSMKRLRAIVDQYVGQELTWGVKLVLKKEEVPAMTLGKQGQLGWTTWLSSRQPAGDVDHLIVDPFRDSKTTEKLPAPGHDSLKHSLTTGE